MNGVPVVIWTLEQDKKNTGYIEKYVELDTVNKSLVVKVADLIKAMEQDSISYDNVSEALSLSNEQKAQLRDVIKKCNQRTGIANEKADIHKDRTKKIAGVALVELLLIILLLL